MDSFPGSPNRYRAFFESEVAGNNLIELCDRDEINWDMLLLDFGRGECSLQFSNSNSPCIGKRGVYQVKHSEMGAPQLPFKITKHVSKRPKCDKNPVTPPALRNPSCHDLSSTVCSWIESPMKVKFGQVINYSSQDEPLFDTESETFLKQQIPRTKHIFSLLLAYLNGVDWTSFAAQIHSDYEYRIISLLFAHLRISLKISTIDSPEKLFMLLKQKPNRPKKRLKMIQSIFTQTIGQMKLKFELESGPLYLTQENTQLAFISHYFSDNYSTADSLTALYSLKDNIKNRNLSYEFIERLFRHKAFAEDFNKHLDTVLPRRLKLIRMERLADLCASWEFYLSSISDEEAALEKIRGEIINPVFHLPWAETEISLYYPYFRNLHSKLTKT